MVHVTAAPMTGQADCRTIVSYAPENERIALADHTPPSTTLLVLKVPPDFHPRAKDALPTRTTFGMPKHAAALIATAMNQQQIEESATRHPNDQRVLWSIVVMSPAGFHVSQIHVYGWQPETMFDLPPDAWPNTIPNVVARCSAKEFNARQLAAAGEPRYWCLPVKRIREADLKLPAFAKAEGGAA